MTEDLLAACAEEIGTPAAEFAQGVLDEDHAWRSIGTRMTNWHYAKNSLMDDFAVMPRGHIGKVQFPVPLPWMYHTHLYSVFARRVKELHESCDAGDTLEKAGRVAHFLQDMRVPAHVIPVDHGAMLPNDPFDAALDRGKPIRLNSVRPEVCRRAKGAALTADRDELRRRLDAARKATHDWVGTAIAPGAACRFDEIFWCDPENTKDKKCPASLKGFGSYIPGAPEWGAEKAMCKGDSVTIEYPSAWRDAMAEDTMFVLFYAERLLEKCRPQHSN